MPWTFTWSGRGVWIGRGDPKHFSAENHDDYTAVIIIDPVGDGTAIPRAFVAKDGGVRLILEGMNAVEDQLGLRIPEELWERFRGGKPRRKPKGNIMADEKEYELKIIAIDKSGHENPVVTLRARTYEEWVEFQRLARKGFDDAADAKIKATKSA